MIIKLTQTTIVPAAIALRLSSKQERSRAHAIEPFGSDGGVFVGKEALQFKAGEIIDVVGDIPKGMLPVYDSEIKKSRGRPKKSVIEQLETLQS